MNIVVQRLDNKALLPVQLDDPDATVGDLKGILSAQLSACAAAQRLIYPSRDLPDDVKLTELHLPEGKHMFLLLREGKPSKIKLKFQNFERFNVSLRMHRWQKLSTLLTEITTMLEAKDHSSLGSFKVYLLDRHNRCIDAEIQGNDRMFQVFGNSSVYCIQVKLQQSATSVGEKDYLSARQTDSQCDEDECDSFLSLLFS